MKFNHLHTQESDRLLCTNKQMPVSYGNYDCLYDYKRLRDFYMEFSGYGKPVVQDIDLRVREIPLFKVGPLRSVLYSWLDQGFFPMGTMNFASEVWDHLGNYLFYFSVPVKTQLSLRLGTLKREVRMRNMVDCSLAGC